MYVSGDAKCPMSAARPTQSLESLTFLEADLQGNRSRFRRRSRRGMTDG
jgi:hypothetical protein